MGGCKTMGRRNYVSDIYQWVIDDVIAKLRSQVIYQKISESILVEIAEKWEQRILKSRICEASDPRFMIPNTYTSLFSSDEFRARNFSSLGKSTILVPLEMQLQQYQDAVRLLSAQFIKIPKYR